MEDAELAGKEATEPMPRNVQDFKNHPYYALERHLKRNEVIHPKREVGKVSAGKVAATELEPVYRRRDVVIVKSVDKWYRLGREVKVSLLCHDDARRLELSHGEVWRAAAQVCGVAP